MTRYHSSAGDILSANGRKVDLAPSEQRCCHMAQWGLDGQSLGSWRAEFRTIPRSEHCRDCPLLARDKP